MTELSFHMPVWGTWLAKMRGWMRADRMAQKCEELRLRNERLELAWNGVGDGMWDWDIVNNRVFYSPRFAELLGYDAHELAPTVAEWKDRLHASDTGYVLTALQAHLDQHAPFDVEYRLRVKTGEWKWFKARGQAIWDADGKPVRMAGSLTDIADHKFAESIRDRLIKQLIAANEQLEQFAYVASHDLREPLRIVVSFSDLLTRDYGARLDEEGQHYMAIMRQSAKKMEAMVADLLDYGRLAENVERPAPTDCNRVLQDALDNLAESIQGTQAAIERGPLPEVNANPVRLTRLFQNLINNALRYQAAGNRPVVRIYAEDKGDHWQFAVADNGIGIRADYLESIFVPFRRLHDDRDYSGTGIGLAICKKIVESCGGAIHAQSTVGEGSVFYFTLPKNKPSE